MSVILLAAMMQAPVRVVFRPNVRKQYVFRVVSDYRIGGVPSDGDVVGNPTDSFHGYHKEYDATLSFTKKGQKYAMHGRIGLGKQSRNDGTDADTKELTDQLNRTKVNAVFDLVGRLVGNFDMDVSSNSTTMEALPDELAGWALMDFDYPPKAVTVGSTWSVVMPAERYRPNGEMIGNEKGQKVTVTYRVTKISPTTVTISAALDASVKAVAWPVDDHFVVKMRQRSEYTLDHTDGLLISGRIERGAIDHDSLSRLTVVFTRR